MATSSRLVAAKGMGGTDDEKLSLVVAGSSSHSAKRGASYKESFFAALGLVPNGE